MLAHCSAVALQRRERLLDRPCNTGKNNGRTADAPALTTSRAAASTADTSAIEGAACACSAAKVFWIVFSLAAAPAFSGAASTRSKVPKGRVTLAGTFSQSGSLPRSLNRLSDLRPTCAQINDEVKVN